MERGLIMKVWNLAHQNQYVWYENGEYHFQSYDTEVAIYTSNFGTYRTQL